MPSPFQFVLRACRLLDSSGLHQVLAATGFDHRCPWSGRNRSSSSPPSPSVAQPSLFFRKPRRFSQPSPSVAVSRSLRDRDSFFLSSFFSSFFLLSSFFLRDSFFQPWPPVRAPIRKRTKEDVAPVRFGKTWWSYPIGQHIPSLISSVIISHGC